MKTNKKVIIIGGVAAGTSAAAKLRRMSENIEITLYEKYEYISYATCGLPYFVSGKIKNLNELLVSTVQSFAGRFNVNVQNLHEVIKIIPAEKVILVKNLKTGKEFKDNYDYLIIATGASVINLPIAGSDASNIFALKTIDDALKIKDFLDDRITPSLFKLDGKEICSFENIVESLEKSRRIKSNIVIIGAGFVGLEMLEAFLHKNFSVIIIEKADQMLPAFDKEIIEYVENYLQHQGVFVLKKEEVSSFEKNTEGDIKAIKTASGKTIETNIVFAGIGVRPENSLAKEAGINTGEKDGVIVDEFMQTNVADIYAVGDCVECEDLILKNKKIYYLASIANKQGRISANNVISDILKKSHLEDNNHPEQREIASKRYVGSIGTSIIKILDVAIAKTGLSFAEAKKSNPDAEKIEAHFLSHAGYYPGAQMMHMVLIYDRKSHYILGFEVIGREGVDKKTDIIATAIKGNLKVEDLAYCDFAYQPEFGAAKDSINLLGMIGENLFDGEVEFINCEDLRYILNKDNGVNKSGSNDFKPEIQNLTKEDIFILDVRTHGEYGAGCIEGANLIPLNSLRENLDNIDRSKLVIVYCQTGYRAYLGYKILKNNGFENVRCLNGSYLSWDRRM